METLREQFAHSKALRRRIMRRVWYAYSISLLLRPALLVGFLFGASIIAFWKLVSVSSIIQNILNVRIGEAPSYVIQSLLQAEFITLMVFAVIVGVSGTVFFRILASIRLPSYREWQGA